MSNLQIMIFHNQSHKPFQQRFRFQWRYVVDVLHVLTDGEDRLPPCDGICADDWMNGGEFFADVVWGASGVGVEFKVSVFGSLIELGLRVSSGQGVKKLLVRGGKAVVKLVSRSPKRV